MKDSSHPSKEGRPFGGAPAPRPSGGGFGGAPAPRPTGGGFGGGMKESFRQPNKEGFSSTGSFSGARSNFEKESPFFSKDSSFQPQDSSFLPEARSTGGYGSSPLLILLVLGVLFVIALCIVGLGLSG